MNDAPEDNEPGDARPTLTRRRLIGGVASLPVVGFGAAALAQRGRTSTNPTYTVVPPKAGKSYNWGSDHIFVKVTSRESGGAYTLIEDNINASFSLGLHVHRKHAETFYILEGSIDFFVDGKWITLTEGATLHIPPGIPHAAVTTPGIKSARMIMIFQPGGFDVYLAEFDAMSAADRARPEKMKALNERHDFIMLGPVPKRS